MNAELRIKAWLRRHVAFRFPIGALIRVGDTLVAIGPIALFIKATEDYCRWSGCEWWELI